MHRMYWSILEPRRGNYFFKEAARVLKKGGILRIVVPDFYQLCCRYINEFSSGKEGAIDSFLFWQNLHRDNFYGQERNIFKKVYDSSQGYPHLHEIMFDYHSLKKQLSDREWINVTRETYGKSSLIPEIKDVEYTNDICPSIYLECVRKS